jgi:uncharacterized protein YaaR (DUF327 family)
MAAPDSVALTPNDPSLLVNSTAYEAAANLRSQSTRKTEKKGLLGALQRHNFRQALDQAAELELPHAVAPSNEALESRWDNVHSTADDLLSEPYNPLTIAAYKQAVRDFMAYVVQNGLNVRKSKLRVLKKVRSPDGEKEWKEKTKGWAQVETVDKKLEDMANELLRGQLKQLELLAAIDEINGLLVNLYVGGEDE